MIGIRLGLRRLCDKHNDIVIFFFKNAFKLKKKKTYFVTIVNKKANLVFE